MGTALTRSPLLPQRTRPSLLVNESHVAQAQALAVRPRDPSAFLATPSSLSLSSEVARRPLSPFCREFRGVGPKSGQKGGWLSPLEPARSAAETCRGWGASFPWGPGTERRALALFLGLGCPSASQLGPGRVPRGTLGTFHLLSSLSSSTRAMAGLQVHRRPLLSHGRAGPHLHDFPAFATL